MFPESQDFRIDSKNQSINKSIKALNTTIASQTSQIDSQNTELNNITKKYPITFTYNVNDIVTLYYKQNANPTGEDGLVNFDFYQAIENLQVTTDYMNDEDKPDDSSTTTAAYGLDLFIRGNGLLGPSVIGFESYTISARDNDDMVVLCNGQLESIGSISALSSHITGFSDITINDIDEILHANLTEIDNIQGDFKMEIDQQNNRTITFYLTDAQMDKLIGKNIAYFDKK